MGKSWKIREKAAGNHEKSYGKFMGMAMEKIAGNHKDVGNLPKKLWEVHEKNEKKNYINSVKLMLKFYIYNNYEKIIQQKKFYE